MVDTTRVLAVSGLAAGAAAGVLTGLAEQPAAVVLASAGIPAGLGIAAEVRGHLERQREERLRRQREAEEAAAREQERARRLAGALRFWPLPRVAEVDPFAVGVHPPALPGGRAGDLGVYVPRDVDHRAEEALQATGMLLLVGEPGGGATRTAWELATRQYGDRRLLAPEPGQSGVAVDDLDVLSEVDVKGTHLVVWVDRIHQFPEVTPTLLRHCRDGSRGLRVIATIPTTELTAWEAEHATLIEATTAGTPGFTKIQVPQLLSPAEKDRAQAAYPGLDITWGIGAAFTGLSSLLRREQAGDHQCPFEPVGGDCAVARALVHVACFWPTTGTTRPLTVPGLAEAVTRRLGPAVSVEDDHLEHAFAWATRPVVEGISLLTRTSSPDGAPFMVAHPGLAEAVTTRDTPDPGVWLAALEDAQAAGDSETVGRIGYHAHRAGLLDVATTAWDRIPTLDDPGVEWIRQAIALSERQHRTRPQIPPLQRLLTLTETKHGPDHVQVAATLVSLGNAGYLWGDAGRARDLFERALTIFEGEYGPDHVKVAVTLVNLGAAWKNLGDAGRARDLFERALTIEEREYGPDHVQVARTLVNLGGAWLALGQPRTAKDLLERALTIQEREYGPDHVEVAIYLGNLGSAWYALGHLGRARDLFERVLTIEEREYGPDHVKVARTLTNLGVVWRELGQVGKAQASWERARHIYRAQHRPKDVAHVERLLRQASPDVIPLDDGATAVNPNPPPVENPDTPLTGYDPANPDLGEPDTE